MANIGKASDQLEVFRRLQEACQLAQLEYIDFAYFEVDDEDINKRSKEINQTITTLQQLVAQEKLQSYGIKVSVAPYKYHNPPLRG